MAHKDNSPAISFFSFQDIITSLTGIMFLIVLLLVIFMIEMKPKTDDAPISARESEDLTAQIRQFQTEIAELRKKIPEIDRRIEELLQTDPEAILNKVLLLRAQTAEIRQELQVRNAEYLSQEELAKRQSAESAKLQAEKPLEEQKNIRLKAELKKLSDLAKQQTQNMLLLKKATRFTVENHSAANPVLVECSKNGLMVLDCATGKKTKFADPSNDPSKIMSAFLEWAKKRNHGKEYYTILLKPESFDYGRLAYALGLLRISRGLEILPDDNTTIFEQEP